MKASDFRRIALGMAGAEERSHMNHPDFRASGRIFATLTEDETRGMVVLTPERQAQFMRASSAFAPAAGAWGRQGCTMIALRDADEEVVGDAMTLAWQLSQQKTAARRSNATAPSKAKPAPKARRAGGHRAQDRTLIADARAGRRGRSRRGRSR